MCNLFREWFRFVVVLIFVLSLFESRAEGQTRKTTGAGSKVQKVPAKKTTPVSRDALNRQMTFRLVSACDGRLCPGFILAQGVIAATTPKDFERFLASQAKNTGLSLNPMYFDSLGGSLYGGLVLGRMIRQFELSTTVGSDYFDEPEMWNEGVLPKRPVCYSACAYAFMGGKTRNVATVGKLGLHQFRSAATTDEASTQITMAVLGKYLDEMGIRRKVLDIAALTLPEKIRIINVKEAEALNIISNDIEKGEWTLGNLDDGSLFLTLSQKEFDSQFVLLLYRDSGSYILQILFSIKQKFRRASELREIFNDVGDTEPALCVVDDKGNCLIDIPFRIVEGWRMDEKLVASISFRLSRSALMLIVNGSKLEFEPHFPRVYMDVWPNVTVSTAKLKGLINALDKSK
jgi:hypothetical protein